MVDDRCLSRVNHFCNGIAFIAIKEHIRVEGKQDIQTKAMPTLFARFAEIERDLISERTRGGLAKASGKKLGRPKGSLGVSRLDGKEDEIRRFLRLDVSKSAIAKITGVSRPTLYHFIGSRGLRPSPQRAGLQESDWYPYISTTLKAQGEATYFTARPVMRLGLVASGFSLRCQRHLGAYHQGELHLAQSVGCAIRGTHE